MRAALILLAALAWPAQAAWQWGEPLDVNSVRGAKIFPHLESANREGVAVSGGTVGVVWEDDRDGVSHCYLATKPAAATRFEPEIGIGGTECYEPVLLGLGDGRFLAAWEESGKVRARLLPGGTTATLSAGAAAQVALAAGGGKLYAAWAERDGRFPRIVVARLALTGSGPRVETAQPVEAGPPGAEQDWPALAVAGDASVIVAWEDRREGHTVPLVSHSRDDGRTFAPPTRLTDLKGGSRFGTMRPTLTAWGAQGVAAVWLDKRDFLSGYDVYAALDLGARSFGKNLKVQDSFGDDMPQWHAKVIGDASGRLLAVWDDARDGTPDVWMADWNGDAFGDNVAVPAAAGPGAQTDPVAVLDGAGTLHVVWLERDEQRGTRVRYVRAVPR